MNVLVFNVGSTTLKYACIDTESGNRMSQGLIDRIGQIGGDAPDHLSAANLAVEKHDAVKIDAIGHRVVHGGDFFADATLVSHSVLGKLAQLDSLAPLHNPPARAVIEAIMERELAIEQVMVFDTAYFSTLPPKAYRYAVPTSIYREHNVRRYGFHGTSHRFVTQKALGYLEKISTREQSQTSRKIISLHLGGGASVTASVDGVAIETSLGMTPLEGLVMATRTGDIDPSVPLHLIRKANLSVEDVDNLLTKQSGLLGLCGDVDMRAILKRCESGDEEALLAIDIYVHRILKYIGGYFAVLGGLDALVFTAGVGENAAAIREQVASRLNHLGIEMDREKNRAARPQGSTIDLSRADAKVRTLVVPTDEEKAISEQVERFLNR